MNNNVSIPTKPIVVADVQPLWIRLPFEQLGYQLPVLGLRPYSSWNLTGNFFSHQYHTGYDEIDFPLPPQLFGRFGKWLAPLAILQLRRFCGEPRSLVFTFPNHSIYPRLGFRNIPSYYYVSDDYLSNYGFNPDKVYSWEKSLVHRVKRVFTVSNALADCLSERHGVSLNKFTVVPNGLPQSWILDRIPTKRPLAPAPIPTHFSPLIGILGGINKRLHLDWIVEGVKAMPWSYWAFVGPVGELDEASTAAIEFLKSHPRCCFTGEQSYDQLPQFAVSFDVAVIPYKEDDFNARCSPVRFFSQLAFGQPIIATPSCDQFVEYSEVISFAKDFNSLIYLIENLRKNFFRDGLEKRRLLLARANTWRKRSESMLNFLH